MFRICFPKNVPKGPRYFLLDLPSLADLDKAIQVWWYKDRLGGEDWAGFNFSLNQFHQASHYLSLGLGHRGGHGAIFNRKLSSNLTCGEGWGRIANRRLYFCKKYLILLAKCWIWRYDL